ncbi:MAG TPA: DUF885 domain-containing protein [Pirellulales bacterium]|jgi:uncharacterized protein (DUF885 family)|nr:DUF885 domain-containing protein [Pirellulales bacterium]
MLFSAPRPLSAILAIVVGLMLGGPVLAAPTASDQLRELLAADWDFEMHWDPLWATHVGDHRFDDRLPDRGLRQEQAYLAEKRQTLARWQAIDWRQLAPRQRLDYDTFGILLKNTIAEEEFQTYLIPITNRSGFHISFPELPDNVPLNTKRNYENYIARLRAFGRYADQNIDLLRAGIERGMTLPAEVLRDYRRPIDAQIVDDPKQSALYKPFLKFPNAIGTDDRPRLAAAARDAIRGSVVPAYQRFLAFMRDEYVPHARGSIAASALPRGREFYRHRVRSYTSLDLSPEQVHELGQSEVKRIDAEMRSVIGRVGFKGDFAAFVAQLRSDPKFYADSPEALLKQVAWVMKQVDGRLPSLFGTLPRTPCGIRQVPAFIAPSTTTAYYQQPSGDGTRAGFYFVNTYDLKSRPLFEVEALTCHEAIPGHHLQLALQQERADLPKFRRFGDFTAFIEGWGLYAERLGLELGLYEDPFSDFGRLSYEAWRACRLVVDSGIHYFGWTRQQAIDFMAAHTALTMHNIRSEVDRYIAWPGQALAYKVGELKFRELRKRATERLGERFDVRRFHDVVLAGGAVPLSLLEKQVDAWIVAEEKTAKTGDAKQPAGNQSGGQ